MFVHRSQYLFGRIREGFVSAGFRIIHYRSRPTNMITFDEIEIAHRRNKKW